MGKNWAIVIGINQYRNLQPLQFAVRDAAAMRVYFRDEVHFQQVYYFADDAPPIVQDHGPPLDATPTFTTLNRFLRVRFEQPFLETGDNLWCFFAGQGLRHEDRDYLLPLDGDPGDVVRSAIPINYLTERLRRSGADNVVLLLDACRSQGGRAGLGVGEEVPQGVVTLFSCSPREASYEIEGLQQGAFTHTLLRGLRLQGEGNCATVERLDAFLREAVPAVNRQHGKPRQTPYATVEPAAKYHLILLPRQATLRDAATLKMDAYSAETERDLELAAQLWIRVLAVSPADSEASNGIRRLAQLPLGTRRKRQPARTGTQAGASSRGGGQIVAPSLPLVLTRRQLVEAGLVGAGLGSALLVKACLPPLRSPMPTASSSSSPGASAPASLPSTAPSTVAAPVLQTFAFEVVSVNAQGKETKRQQSKAQYFTEDLGGGNELIMVSLPGGTFQMGSPASEKERSGDEGPQHPVMIKRFLMGKYAVTQAQWQAVAGLPQVKQKLDANLSKLKGAKRPVERVAWHDAVEFCERLSRKTGRTYRLPSEAEWEYACRAGTTTPFHFGATITTDLANYRGTDAKILGMTYSGFYDQGPRGVYREQTTDVGSFPPNAFGLYDMHGNVGEWCLDHWRLDHSLGLYQSYRPTDGSAWIDGRYGFDRLVRGGSLDDSPSGCRSATRIGFQPDWGVNGLGFRVVCASA
ncbi:MAG TPA: SUMF1/EgtB/PvdO family nonheme iron enzyme [Candidatus Sericytochromatia bacterium]|jgi:formylglycine-generating enzyme required for sulfatase activity/uncharacterized caspase-like protein